MSTFHNAFFASIYSYALTIENLTIYFSYDRAASKLIFVHIFVHQKLEILKLTFPETHYLFGIQL